MTLRLLDFEQPLEDVEFPDGKQVPVHPFGPGEYALWREIQTSGDDAKAADLVRRCVPTATDDDLATLTPTMARAIVAHAMHRLELVMTAIKNAEPGTETLPSRSRRSRRKTTKRTSSHA